VLLLALVAAVSMSQGCRYAQHRLEDALEIVDIGLTFSDEPQVGLYWNSLDLLVFGYSNVDGYFAGWGGGQIGITRHYNNCYGLIVGHEEIGWGEFDKDDPETLYVRYSGLAGLPSMATGGSPNYTPACVHFFPHIGYVGLVWNARWMEMVDFVLGWTTIDISGDDGYKVGEWSFPWREG
jgi:hypothetical protein